MHLACVASTPVSSDNGEIHGRPGRGVGSIKGSCRLHRLHRRYNGAGTLLGRTFTELRSCHGGGRSSGCAGRAGAKHNVRRPREEDEPPGSIAADTSVKRALDSDLNETRGVTDSTIDEISANACPDEYHS